MNSIHLSNFSSAEAIKLQVQMEKWWRGICWSEIFQIDLVSKSFLNSDTEERMDWLLQQADEQVSSFVKLLSNTTWIGIWEVLIREFTLMLSTNREWTKQQSTTFYANLHPAITNNDVSEYQFEKTNILF